MKITFINRTVNSTRLWYCQDCCHFSHIAFTAALEREKNQNYQVKFLESVKAKRTKKWRQKKHRVRVANLRPQFLVLLIDSTIIYSTALGTGFTFTILNSFCWSNWLQFSPSKSFLLRNLHDVGFGNVIRNSMLCQLLFQSSPTSSRPVRSGRPEAVPSTPQPQCSTLPPPIKLKAISEKEAARNALALPLKVLLRKGKKSKMH